MARLNDLATRRGDLLMIDPRIIKIEPGFNVRNFEPDADPDDLQLLENIRSNGVLQSIMIRLKGDDVVVVDGHRRLQAAQMLCEQGAEILTIPCVPEKRGTSDADRDLSLLISDGKPKTALQNAVAMKRLLGYGWTEEMIAERTGMPLDKVRGTLDLAGADRAITDMVVKGTVTEKIAMTTIKKSGVRAKAVLEKAAAVAKESGKKRVTAKTIERAKTENPTPEVTLNARGKQQISKRTLTRALREILDSEELSVIHHIARTTLGIKKTHLEAAENAEILREFKVVPAQQSKVTAEQIKSAEEW